MNIQENREKFISELNDIDPDKIAICLINNHDKLLATSQTYKLFFENIVLKAADDELLDKKVEEQLERIKEMLAAKKG